MTRAARGRAPEALGQRVAAVAGQRDADRLRERRRRGDPLLGQHLQAAGERRVQLRRQARGELVELEHVAVARRRADQQRPQRRGEAEDVAGGADGAAGEDLGRHVARRADRDRALVLLLGAERAGDAEVHEHDAVVAQDHVLRLDVAVHDLLAVHVGQRLAAVADVLDRVADREPRVAAALEDRAQVHAVDEVHDDVEALVVARVVEHLDHARVAQAGQQARLDLEAGGVTDVQQALDRDVGARSPGRWHGKPHPSPRWRWARRSHSAR